jgi:putative ABC transport system substrate-binding protein
VKRREFIALAGMAAAWPLAARAQQGKPRIGILLVASREPLWSHFRDGLRDVGYIPNESILVDFRSAEGKLTNLPGLAAELVQSKVDVIVASETPAVQAAKQATQEIPIVMAPAGDPVATGLISSLAQPGGNVTGLSAATAEIAGKSLDLIREILPSAKRVAVLSDPTNPFSKTYLEQIGLSARTIGLEIEPMMVRGPQDFDAAFAEMERQGTPAVIVQPTLPRKEAIDAALKYRRVAVSGNRAFAAAGGLLSYAGSVVDRYRNAAGYVDKILKGAKPADLPVQQPTRFELVINLKTAKALDLTIPQTMLARADEVIE